MPQHDRFRMPRNTLRRGAVVVAGAAGLTIGVLTGSAQAGGHDWSAVAQCESSGDWNVNTGNGYYGGLQFSASTWAAYGGRAHAARADLASPAQQIAVAERVLAGQGVGAWPNCGRHLRGGTTDVPVQVAPEPVVEPAVNVQTSGGSYAVRPGDTLSTIARDQGVAGDWQALWANNRATVADPDMIQVGQRLQL